MLYGVKKTLDQIDKYNIYFCLMYTKSMFGTPQDNIYFLQILYPVENKKKFTIKVVGYRFLHTVMTFWSIYICRFNSESAFES